MSSKVVTPDFSQFPDASGHFGPYGGRFVSETLIFALDELAAAYQRLRKDPAFQAEFDHDLAHYVGRPSPLYYAKRWSEEVGGARIFLKREDLNHTGAHKVNNTVGQALLAKYMGKKTCDRGNRRGPARRCDRNRCCAFGHDLPGVYGRRGYSAAGLKCLSHEITRR